MNGAAIKPNSTTSGARAEDIACAYLQGCGLRLVQRNYRCRSGEIDLIMRDGEDLVFIEVRYRRQDAFVSPAESISSAKRARIIATAIYYLQQQPSEPPCRFDVVAIAGSNPHRVEWIRDAFQGQ